MNNLPNNSTNVILNFKNKYPSIFVTVLITIIVLSGYLLYSTTLKLNKSEIKINESQTSVPSDIYIGRVRFSGNVEGKDTFELFSEDGEFIAELITEDEKLKLVENLVVQIKGDYLSGRNGNKSIIIVDEVILNSSVK